MAVYYPGRTEGYLGTFDLKNPEDMKVVAWLRMHVRRVNKEEHLGPKIYTKLQGRLGENNPNAHKYRHGGKYGSHQCIRLADAQTADLYVYERADWWGT